MPEEVVTAENQMSFAKQKMAYARKFFGSKGLITDNKGLLPARPTEQQLASLKQWNQETSEGGILMPTLDDFYRKTLLAVSLWHQRQNGATNYLLGKGVGAEIALQGQVQGRTKRPVVFPYRAHSDFELYDVDYNAGPDGSNLGGKPVYTPDFQEVFGGQEYFPPTATKGLKNLPTGLLSETAEVVDLGGVEVYIPELELLFLDKYFKRESTPRAEGFDAELIARQYVLDRTKIHQYLDKYVEGYRLEDGGSSLSYEMIKVKQSIRQAKYYLGDRDIEPTPQKISELLNSIMQTDRARIDADPELRRQFIVLGLSQIDPDVWVNLSEAMFDDKGQLAEAGFEPQLRQKVIEAHKQKIVKAKQDIDNLLDEADAITDSDGDTTENAEVVESEAEQPIKPLYRGIWAEELNDGDVIPVGGNIFSNDLDKFLQVDTGWMEGKVASFTKERIREIYKGGNEKIFREWLEGNNFQIDPELFHTLLQVQTVTRSLLKVGDESVYEERSGIYRAKKKAKLSEFIGKSECAEQAVVGKFLLDKLGIDSTLMEGVHVDGRSDDPHDHTFLILDDPQGKGSLIFDIARPKASIQGYPRILRTDRKIDYATFSGKDNYVVPATDIYNGTVFYYGVGHSSLMRDINFADQIPTEQDGKSVEVSQDRLSARIDFPQLNLSAENPRSEAVSVTFAKAPIRVEEGHSYAQNEVLIDGETEKMRHLAQQAEKLKTLPEHDRPKAVLELLRNNMHYAYDDVIQEIAKTNPELAQWVANNTGLDSSSHNNLPLSELIDKGYGICRHLSVAYLWLAQKAGLEGVILHGNVDRNIQRSDTGERLFKSIALDDKPPFHVWAEIRTSDGKWIPVDPSTQLVGDTEEGMAMFRQAGYKAPVVGNGIIIDFSPNAETRVDTSAEAVFMPGEDQAYGQYQLLLKSIYPTKKRARPQFPGDFRTEDVPPTNEPYSGEGFIRFQQDTSIGYASVAINTVTS